MSALLDLGRVDPPVWRVVINDTAYGPYTLGQMQAFIDEGRIGLRTKVTSGEGSPIVAAETQKELQAALRKKYISKAAPQDDSKAATPHNYVVIAQLSGSSEDALIRKLNSFGSFGEALPGVFVLRSTASLSLIQKSLKETTDIRDRVIIVDASNNRLGWFNLGPESDVHLKTIWDKKIS